MVKRNLNLPPADSLWHIMNIITHRKRFMNEEVCNVFWNAHQTQYTLSFSRWICLVWTIFGNFIENQLLHYFLAKTKSSTNCRKKVFCCILRATLTLQVLNIGTYYSRRCACLGFWYIPCLDVKNLGKLFCRIWISQQWVIFRRQ